MLTREKVEGSLPGRWWWWWSWGWWWWLLLCSQGQYLVWRDSSWRSRHHGSDPALGGLGRVERTDDVHARLFSSWRALRFFDFETEQNFEDAKTCSGSLITAPVNLCISLTLPPPLPMIRPTWMSTSSSLAVTSIINIIGFTITIAIILSSLNVVNNLVIIWNHIWKLTIFSIIILLLYFER